MGAAEVRVACRLVPGGWDCHVKIRGEAGPTGASDHDVTVSEAELQRFGKDVSPERLVTASITFLLKREPAESILRRFQLSEIERYFPEYPAEIGKLLE